MVPGRKQEHPSNLNRSSFCRYLSCVSQTMKKLQPFGDVPKKLTEQLRRSFVATRTFAQALMQGKHVVNKILKVRETERHFPFPSLLTPHQVEFLFPRNAACPACHTYSDGDGAYDRKMNSFRLTEPKRLWTERMPRHAAQDSVARQGRAGPSLGTGKHSRDGSGVFL